MSLKVAFAMPYCGDKMHFIQRFFQVPSKSFFLFGPRGTGKSTLLKSRYKEALWIDLLQPDILRSYLARPERLYEIIEGHRGSSVIVIDEVQKAPQLKPYEGRSHHRPLC